MKTDELVHTLAADTTSVAPRSLTPRLLLATAAAVVVWLALLIPIYGMPATAAPHGWFWMKNTYSLVLALVGLVAVVRLARPGGRVGWIAWIALAAVAALAMMAMRETMRAAPGEVVPLWLGQTWAICPVRILVVGAPMFVAAFWLLRRMAPTRPALAGAAAGFFAGAMGAATYGLYCQESAAAFVVVWYTLGIVICAGLGAGLGRWLLRW
ncbi:MAG TPA: DUF1109 domain-containing protein [Caulobacteraceae bacterium]|nr:DUF1109 domain-containing protein [Caulobacteraceae bacterium]